MVSIRGDFDAGSPVPAAFAESVLTFKSMRR
jgi:hypothetical protein